MSKDARHAFCNNVALPDPMEKAHRMADPRVPLFFAAILALAGCASEPMPLASPFREPREASPSECRARADSNRPQFIVGYGSLMEDESRKRTSPRAGPAHPVDLAGFERGWFERGSATGFSTTYLGVRPDSRARLNAVVYAVEPEEIGATDARESSYCRSAVLPASIAVLDPGFALPDNAQLWIYVTDPRRVAPPDARYPIVQSYVDVFLSGCLEQEERFHVSDFARRCIETTTGWSEHWVNDRIYPRRPFVHQPRAGAIDRLLSSTVPGEFDSIRLEAGATAAPR